MSSPSKTAKKRVAVKGNKFFKWGNGKYPGVYLAEGDSPEILVDKVTYAHEKDFPIYIVETNYKRYTDAHDVLTFLTNVGFVPIFVSYVNDNRTPAEWISFKVADYVKDTNMNRYHMKSERVKLYYESLSSKGRKVEGKPYRMPNDYEFFPVWFTLSSTVSKVEND